MSTKTTPDCTPASRPAKPHKDYPLFAHGSGQWAKKIKGRTHYFGAWADPAGALKRYEARKDSLLAGRAAVNGDGLTIAALVGRFLQWKRDLVESGELSEAMWDDYHRIFKTVLKMFGKGRLVSSIGPDDFARLRAAYAKGHAPIRVKKDLTCVRGLFKFAEKNLKQQPTDYGQSFALPSKTVLRKARAAREKKLFSRVEIHALLGKAGPQMRAMILLGINCGFGNNDVALLDRRHIRGGWVSLPRSKTGIDRRCPLWPETVAALAAVRDMRPDPRDESLDGRIFITKRGHAWQARTTTDAPITKEFAKLSRALGIRRAGVNFYALRHTFQTVGARSRDKDAVKSIMGHVAAANDMSAVYDEDGPDDARLMAVCEFIRGWLFD